MTTPRVPLSTYRLQFNRDFTFAQATRIVPYLAALGISHCYASPYLRARPGSTHGYDIIDRLTSAAYTGTPNETYAYDSVGNRTSSHKSATYSYQPNNRLVSTASASYIYNNNGNTGNQATAATANPATPDTVGSACSLAQLLSSAPGQRGSQRRQAPWLRRRLSHSCRTAYALPGLMSRDAGCLCGKRKYCTL